MSESKELTYTVPGVSCGHCVSTITEAVESVDGVEVVDVDLASKRVTVRGQPEDVSVRAAITGAGYDLVA